MFPDNGPVRAKIAFSDAHLLAVSRSRVTRKVGVFTGNSDRRTSAAALSGGVALPEGNIMMAGSLPSNDKSGSLTPAGSSTRFQQSANFLPFKPSGGVKLNVTLENRIGMEHASFH